MNRIDVVSKERQARVNIAATAIGELMDGFPREVRDLSASEVYAIGGAVVDALYPSRNTMTAKSIAGGSNGD